VVLFAFLVVCLCWSTTWQAIRLCLQGYPPLLGAALRFVIATLLLLGIHGYKRGVLRLPGGSKQHLALLLAGVLNGLGYACIYLAEQTLTGGLTAVICASSPLFTLLVARAAGLEPLLPRRMLGMLLGLLGVVVMFFDGLHLGRGHFMAMLLAGLAAALFWPLYGALLKRWAQDVPPQLSTSYFLMYTAVTLLLLSLLRREPLPDLRAVPWVAHAGLLYLAVIGSVVAWTLYLWLLQRLDLSALSMLGLLQPIIALGIDIVSGEAPLQLRSYLGTLLVLLGMALAGLRLRSSSKPSGSPPPASVDTVTAT
jgi:drug/metabolite transporter (DMT)-like permease